MKHIAIAAAVLALAGGAQAGQTCEEKPLTVDTLSRSLDLAARTAARLDASGAQVVVLARAGQDLHAHGLRWSHLGFAVREPAGWRVVHKLNACGTDRSAIYRQGLAPFFTDVHEHAAGFVVLSPELQAKLRALLSDNSRAVRLHQPAYSMVAHPDSSRYQQSNQWAIETLAMAADGDVASRSQAQAWLHLKNYQPTTLHLSTMKRLGARVATANVAFDDHPFDRRMAGRIDTVTVDSVFRWLERSGMGAPAQTVH